VKLHEIVCAKTDERPVIRREIGSVRWCAKSDARVLAHKMEPEGLCEKSDSRPSHKMAPEYLCEMTDGRVAGHRMASKHRYVTLWDCILDVRHP